MPTDVVRQKGKRAREVSARKEFDHWELYTVVFRRGKSKACVATFVERKLRFYIALRSRTVVPLDGEGNPGGTRRLPPSARV